MSKLNLFKSVLIETSTICNLKCTMCPSMLLNDNKKSFMSDKIFESILPYLKDVKVVQLTGGGEPFLDKKILQRIKQVKKYAHKVSITSNGLLMDKKKAEGILENGLDSIYFSFDAATKSLYEKIRVNSNYEKVLTNIKTLIKLKNKNNSKIELGFSYTVTKKNVNEILDFVNLANSLSMNIIIFIGVFSSLFLNKNDICNKDILIKVIEEAKNKFNGKVFTCNIEKKLSNFNCHFVLNESLYIMYNGDVYPCCHLPYPLFWEAKDKKEIFIKGKELGNVLNQPLTEILHKPEYVNFRKKWSEGIIPAECKYCILAHD